MLDLSSYPTATQVLALTQGCGVRPRLFEALLRQFGTLEQIYQAEEPDFLKIEGLDVDLAKRLDRAFEKLPEAEAMVQSMTDRDIVLVNRFDAAYGQLLWELNDPPPLLMVRGSFPDPHRKSAAVVGTRTASAEGMTLTSQVVKELVESEVQVISSLVGGIDAAAHLAARSGGGQSFGVVDCGVDQIEQHEGIPVAIDIIEGGGVLSEYPPESEATNESQAESNRLIIGLSQAVLITEVYQDSKRTLDILKGCREIGKLTFVVFDSAQGAFADETSLGLAVECGAIAIDGLDKIDDIIRSLV
jgi:DNA processing protein